jgi:hypothetical protein
MIDVAAEDEDVVVAWEVEVLEVGAVVGEEELVLEVLELTLDDEEDGELLDERVELVELDELEDEAVLEVVDLLLGRVAMYPAAITPMSRITTITIVCTRVMATLDPSITMFPRSPSHVI